MNFGIKDKIYYVFGIIVMLVVFFFFAANKPGKGTPVLLPTDGKPVVLFFYSRNNVACLEVKPVIEKAEAFYKDRIHVMKVSIDNSGAKNIIRQYNISTPPETYVLKSASSLFPTGDESGLRPSSSTYIPVAYLKGVFLWEKLQESIEKAIAESTFEALPEPVRHGDMGG